MLSNDAKNFFRHLFGLDRLFLNDGLKVTGQLRLQVFAPDGTLKEEVITNTVTTLGKTHIADQLSAVPDDDPMGWIAIGTGTPTTTALQTELNRHAISSRTNTGAVVTYVASWAATEATGALTEAGIFNDDTAGVMMCSASYAVKNITAADTLVATWTLTVN